jgi:septal ring factor EnvC (AmiA/AmiB activator)
LRVASCGLLLVALLAVAPTAAATTPGGGSSSTSRSGASNTTTTTTTAPSNDTTSESAASKVSAKADAKAGAASLRRDREAIRAEVAALRGQREEQYNRWALSQLALENAQNEVSGALMRAEKARLDALDARDRLNEYAAEAFMSPPASESLAVLAMADALEASRAHDLLSIVADEQREAVGAFLTAQDLESRRSKDAEVKVAEYSTAEEASAVELSRLDEMLARQEALDAEIDARLDTALAEVAALDEVDRKAARELEAQEKALAEESKAAIAATPAATPSTPRAPSSSSARPASSASAAPAAPSGTAGSTAPAPVTPAQPATTTTTTAPKPSGPPPAPPSGIVTWQDVTKVGGIWVHRSIASRVEALLAAASASGVSLGGGGFRDPSEQIRLRQAHCGPTEYDVYYKPASQCTPPTAQPGKSMHERGLAIDFTVNGRAISSRSDPAFQWLAANAASYGFYNLPSEPWHWSTNGS